MLRLVCGHLTSLSTGGLRVHKTIRHTVVVARRLFTSDHAASPTGLFMIPGLHQPEDFQTLTHRAIRNCNELQASLAESCGLGHQQSLEVIDQISNEVCFVIDAAELCRNVHHDDSFRAAAEDAFSTLSVYINTLNSNMRIFNSLNDIVSADKSIRAALTAEEQILALDMFHELVTEGIYIRDENAREKLSALQNNIVSLESQYMQNISACSGAIGDTYKLGPLSESQFLNISHWLAAQGITQEGNDAAERCVTMCTNPRVSAMLLRVLDKEELRELVWSRSYDQPAQNKAILGQLIIARQRLSRFLSFDSYAHKSLSRKVLKSPQEVQQLLMEAARGVAHQGDTEADLLKSVKISIAESADKAAGIHGSAFAKKTNNRIYSQKNKKKRSGQELDSVELFPWDEGFLINSYKSITAATDNSVNTSTTTSSENISEYLSVQSCMNGLRYVCAKVFGIQMKTEKVSVSESWTGPELEGGDLLKCSFSGPDGEPLGFIYFDLYARPNKFTGAAHFTVRCGCSNSLEGARSGDHRDTENAASEPQLPVVALVFNFARGANLSIQALETFYHEVGHALHSLLSRTKFQHLSGTRGSTDFVEVPSHLFEHFARDPRVVRSWARKEHELINHIHPPCQLATDMPGTPPPLELIEEALVKRQEFAAIEVQTQLLYALVDQYAFGPDIITDFEAKVVQLKAGGVDDGVEVEVDKAAVIYDLLDEYMIKTSRELCFCSTIRINLLPHTHLVNYGGAYYSYLFAKMHASQIWENQFSEDPLSRRAGETLWKDMLVYGAAKNPTKMLEKLGKGPLDPTFYLNEI